MKAPGWIVRALVAVAVAIPTLALTPSMAHAESSSLVDVTISTTTSPVIDLSKPEQVVELSGTIINTSTDRTRYTTVEFWKSTEPITTAEQLDEVLVSPATEPVGERQQPPSEESGHVQVISREDWFSMGQRADFTVSATVGELELTTDGAVYLVGVQVRGIPEYGDKQVVGRGRILLTASSTPLAFTQVVELAAGPKRNPDGDFVDDSLAKAVATNLDELLTLCENVDATVLLDPMLLMDVRALAKDHTVNGEPVPASDDAAAWVARLEAVIAKGRVLRLPWGDVDLPRASAAETLTEAIQWADDALTDPVLRRLPLAADLGENANPELVRELGQLGFSTVMANNTGGGSIGPVRVVRISDPHQSGMGPGGRNTAAQQLSRRVAEELVAEIPPTYLARTATETRGAAALPLQRRVVPITPDDAAATFTASEDAARWDQLSRRIDDLLSKASFRRDLTGTDDLPQLERVAATALSSFFTTEADAMRWLTANQPPEVNPMKITISAASSFVMGSRTNNFPVTITNALELPVTLRLVFESESPQRIAVPATDFETLEPGESLTLTLTPQASSNSVVTVRGHMETVSGDTFGVPVVIDITATELGRVGWIIIIISGAVVLGGTVWRIRAVQAERSKEDA
ncbi:MAG: DUF6049 family protein [Propionibacteriaceae bacterium]|nr:DUF6049 family protein [Propionibacteriaceae bacterium]